MLKINRLIEISGTSGLSGLKGLPNNAKNGATLELQHSVIHVSSGASLLLNF